MEKPKSPASEGLLYDPAETALGNLEEEEKDPWTGLTSRQRQIQQLKMRGLNQRTIGKIVGISQSLVHIELKEIREVHRQRGVFLDKDAYVGESISIYEELLAKTWDQFFRIPEDNSLSSQMKLQALNVISSIIDKRTKLLIDLGVIDKAPTKVEHKFKVSNNSSIADNWSVEQKAKVAEALLLADFNKLEDPQPDESITDAEFEENED